MVSESNPDGFNPSPESIETPEELLDFSEINTLKGVREYGLNVLNADQERLFVRAFSHMMNMSRLLNSPASWTSDIVRAVLSYDLDLKLEDYKKGSCDV